MSNEPSIIERQALGNLVKVLESKNYKLKEYYRDSFEGWDPIYDSGISGSVYYRTLKNFPLHAKRSIIQTAMKGWNIHKDLLTLHETISSLIYLNLCGPAEYYLMQIVFNFINSFGSKLECLPYIVIDSFYETSYTIRFWKDNTFSRYSYGIIDFQLHQSKEKPLLAVVPWNSILRHVYNISGDDINGELDDDEIDDVTTELVDNIFNNEWIKTHCPWIQSEFELKYTLRQRDTRIIFYLDSIGYINSNGE